MHKLSLEDLLLPKFSDCTEEVIKDTLPKNIGSDYMQSIKLQDDFYFIKSSYNIKSPIQIKTKQNIKRLIITMGLKGSSSFTDLDNNIIDFKENHTTITSVIKSEGFREYKDKDVQQARLVLKDDFLKRNLSNEFQEKYLANMHKNINLIDFSPTSTQSQFIVNDLLNSNLKGELENLYIQGKSLELLYAEINKLTNANTQTILDSYDKDAIFKAKEILINNMRNPPSIVALAKRVHINEFKLKAGFREIFNTSPYKLLLQYKMNEAKKMLESGEYNINEIANLTGYKFASNFTTAFLKEFKISPKNFAKQKNYYL